LPQPFIYLKEKKGVILQNNKKLSKMMFNDVLKSCNLVGQSFKIPLGFGIGRLLEISFMCA
jgi:hypothetical protein